MFQCVYPIYICNILYIVIYMHMFTDTTSAHPSAEDMLLRTDQRGDTPLHAAACNGAVECLLLLLQHGIDPRTKNLTGLKAIDLAVRNRHQKCKSILAEYHLHYCTSSEFDSVLFLATLEVSCSTVLLLSAVALYWY